MVWASIREDYVAVCEVVEKVDHVLRFLILLSNLNSLYFICFILLQIFK
jgi:gustatory receptor